MGFSLTHLLSNRGLHLLIANELQPEGSRLGLSKRREHTDPAGCPWRCAFRKGQDGHRKLEQTWQGAKRAREPRAGTAGLQQQDQDTPRQVSEILVSPRAWPTQSIPHAGQQQPHLASGSARSATHTTAQTSSSLAEPLQVPPHWPRLPCVVSVEFILHL